MMFWNARKNAIADVLIQRHSAFESACRGHHTRAEYGISCAVHNWLQLASEALPVRMTVAVNGALPCQIRSLSRTDSQALVSTVALISLVTSTGA